MADVTLAVSETATNRLFESFRDKFSVSHADSQDLGPLSVSYAAGAKLERGKVEFQNDGTVLIKELDIVYDPLELELGLDIDPVTIGGFCIIPSPFGGCILRAPRKTFFDSDPDVSLPLDLGGIVTTEISASCSAKLKYFTNPSGIALSPWDAVAAGHQNKWQLYLEPGYIDIDFIDIADTAGNIIDALVDAFVDKLLGFLPDWAKNLIKTILGGFSDLVRAVLDIGDDIQEWLSNLLGVSLGLFDIIVQAVLEYFADEEPIFEFSDPYPILPAELDSINGTTLVPVLVPVINPSVAVDTDELVISTSFGSL